MQTPEVSNRAPSIVVLAGGLGTRFGGLKQIAPIGPHGETLLEYSLFDAARAGFGRAVIVIASAFEDAFANEVLPRLASFIDVDYVLQDSEPSTGLLGTGHALLAAETAIDEPFAVINADDFYGRSAYVAAADELGLGFAAQDNACFLIAYALGATLADSGPVSRAIVEHDGSTLLGLTEHTRLMRAGDHAESLSNASANETFPYDTPVSMNFWGFTPDIFGGFRQLFDDFLCMREAASGDEFRLPEAVLTMARAGTVTVDVRHDGRDWFGVTHPDDYDRVCMTIRQLIDGGEYPEQLA